MLQTSLMMINTVYCVISRMVCNFHKCHHPSQKDSTAGSTNTQCSEKVTPFKTTKNVLHFRLADPIQAQRLYEAQRDLRPLHREEETLEPGPASSAQHKVGPHNDGGYKPIIGETTQGTRLSSVRLFCFRLAASTFVTHLHNGENRETHRDHIEKHI